MGAGIETRAGLEPKYHDTGCVSMGVLAPAPNVRLRTFLLSNSEQQPFPPTYILALTHVSLLCDQVSMGPGRAVGLLVWLPITVLQYHDQIVSKRLRQTSNTLS